MTGPSRGGRPLPAPRDGASGAYHVIFVCTGNICRSPMAEVVTRTLSGRSPRASHLTVSSAGTGGWHEGEPMDGRAAAALERAGYPGHPHVARQVSVRGLAELDLVVALDRRHQQTLRGLGVASDRLFLLRAFDPQAGAAADAPDPYYGSEADFDSCLSMIEAGCRGVVAAVEALLGPVRA